MQMNNVISYLIDTTEKSGYRESVGINVNLLITNRYPYSACSVPAVIWKKNSAASLSGYIYPGKNVAVTCIVEAMRKHTSFCCIAFHNMAHAYEIHTSY